MFLPRSSAAALTFCLLGGGASYVSGNETPRSVSSSHQFVVFCADRPLRAAASVAAETIKTRLLNVFQARDEWSIPILVNLQSPQANLPELPSSAVHVMQAADGAKIQVDLLVARDFAEPGFVTEITRALLLELSYRAPPGLVAGQPYNLPPDWLVEGLCFPPSAVAVPSVQVSLERFLAQKPGALDTASRQVYRAQAAVLLQMLLRPAGGARALQAYIADQAKAGADPLADLQEHFPLLGASREEIEQRWNLELTRPVVADEVNRESFPDTLRRLDELLAGKIASANGRKLSLLELERERKPVLDAAATGALLENLIVLQARAHPLLRPVIAQYQEIADRLAKKRRHGLATRLKSMARLRQELTEEMGKIDDFLNWFEATQSVRRSDEFRGYLHAAEPDREVARRHDALSVYLDAMEDQL